MTINQRNRRRGVKITCTMAGQENALDTAFDVE